MTDSGMVIEEGADDDKIRREVAVARPLQRSAKQFAAGALHVKAHGLKR